MASLETSRPVTDLHINLAEEQCPVCDQPIPNERAALVHARFHELMDAKAALERQEEHFSKERIEILAQAERERDQVKREALDEGRKAAQAEIDGLSHEKRDLEVAHKAAERRLLDKVEELKRQLENKTPVISGDTSEINLFESLKERFPGDRIRRVEKGTAGADIIHVVVNGKNECGTILYECKNSTAWKDSYVTKLREDQIAEGAEHAILSTFKLPAELHQLDIHIQDGVIIALPDRVPVLAEILRRDIVNGYRGDKKPEKKDALYSYIMSPSFKQHLEFIDIVAREMLELDTSEEKSHKKVWKKRGILIKSMQDAEDNLRAGIDEVIAQDTA